MTKSELVEAIGNLYNQADELKAAISQAEDLSRQIFRGLEELPGEVSEIEDDKLEEE